MSNNKPTVASLHNSYVELYKVVQLQNSRLNVLEHEVSLLRRNTERKPSLVQRAKDRVRNALSTAAEHRPRIVFGVK